MATRKSIRNKNKKKEEEPVLDIESDDEDSGMRDKSQAPSNDDNKSNLLSAKELFAANNQQLFINNKVDLLKDGTSNTNPNPNPPQVQAIKNDFMAKYLKKSGAASSFNEAEFAKHCIASYFGDIGNDIVNKLMSLDPSIKVGDANALNKYQRFPMMQLLLAVCIMMDTGRAKVSAGIDSDTVLGQSYMVLLEILKVFLRYDEDARAEFVQNLHARLRCGDVQENMAENAELAAVKATQGRFKLPGFDGRSSASDTIMSYPGNGNNNNKRKKNDKRWVDFRQFRDKKNTSFVPPSFCVFHHRVPGGCNRGDNCTHKHRMWTDAELADAKR